MARKFSENELVIATHNAGKAREISHLLELFVPHFYTAGELGLDEPEETGVTFIENAELKALAAAKSANMVALADDSGLAVNALNGDPGIYSARWAGASKDFGAAMEKIRTALESGGSDDYSAYFVCALTLAWPDGHVESFEGRVNGVLTFPPRGGEGFGYDPIFVPNGYDLTFAQMEVEFKHRISHRADAFAQLVAACFARKTV